MQLYKHIILSLFRIIFYYFKKEKTIDYRYLISHSSNIFILCPENINIPIPDNMIHQISKIFSIKKVTLFQPSQNKKIQKSSTDSFIRIFYSTATRIPILQKYKSVYQLSETQYDILLDLDPEFQLFNLHICTYLKPTLRIAFKKQYANRFYNLLYNPVIEDDFQTKLAGLTSFLKTLCS